jgi:hypothetical protein
VVKLFNSSTLEPGFSQKGTSLTPSYEGQIKGIVGKNPSKRESELQVISGTAKSIARAMNKMIEWMVMNRK